MKEGKISQSLYVKEISQEAREWSCATIAYCNLE